MKKMIIQVILKTDKEVKAQENLSYKDYQLSSIFLLFMDFYSLFVRIGKLKESMRS